MDKPDFPDYSDRIHRMKVLWSKARGMYNSFFSEINTIRQEIGDERFASWCFHELQISLSIVDRTSGVLKDNDKEIVRNNLRRAKEYEKAERKAKKEAEAEAKVQVAKELANAIHVEEAAKRKEERKQRQAEKKAVLQDEGARAALAAQLPPAISALLAECATIEKESRVELGRRYAAMKQMVKAKQAGRDLDAKPWGWEQWCGVFLQRTPQWANKCINEYQKSDDDENRNSVSVLHDIDVAEKSHMLH